MTRTALFEAIRPYAPNRSFLPSHVQVIDALADSFNLARDNDPLTARVALELIHHEAIVQEAYKDSVGVWTWSVGLAETGGFNALAYKDKPQPLAVCLAAYVKALRTKYAPAVLKAFEGVPLSEARFAAALSFHYNTGAIGRTEWVDMVRAGNLKGARAFLEGHYLNGGSLTSRRKAEAALFFDGAWKGDGTALVVPVSKPSYLPAFSKAKRVDVRAAVAEAMA